MQLKEFNILLDIKKDNKTDYFEVVQGDLNSNVLNITLVDGLNPYDLTGTNVEIVFSKPDRTTVQQTDITIIDAIQGKIQCILKTNTIASPGKVIAEVRISEGEILLTSARFSFFVRKALITDDTIESTNEFPILNQLLTTVEQIVEQLPENIDDKADKSYVDAELNKKAEKTDIPTKLSELTKDINFDERYYTKIESDAKLDEKVDNSRVLTNVPANAKFTDTITTINGKTGVITKDDIVALGIPAQDTTYSEISEAEIDIGTSSTKRVITGRRVKYILDKVQDWINSLTKADIGLGNVDNVKQATKVEFDTHNNNSTRHITSDERNKWNNKANKSDIPTKVSQLENDENYVTQEELENVDEKLLLKADKDYVDTQLVTKVDKVVGKGLSTEDYTTEEKQKLAGIEEGANKYIHPDTHPASMITESSARRFVSDDEKNTWNTVTDKADKSYVDAELNKKAEKTDIPTKLSELTKDINFDERYYTETEIDTKLAGKVDKVSGKGLSTNDFTNVYKNKLDGIEEGANKYIHPSTHPASMIVETSEKHFVSDIEKAAWNAKETPAGAQAKADAAEAAAKAYVDQEVAEVSQALDAHVADTAPHEYIGGRIFVSIDNKSYYVNPVSGDDDNPGTISQPFKTIAKAISVIPMTIKYGHTINIYLASGEYNEPLLLEGFNCLGALVFIMDSNVILKGTTFVGDFLSNSVAGICIRNCHGFINFADNPINLKPGDIGNSNYIGFAVRNSLLSSVSSLINIDGDDVTTTGVKDGVHVICSSLRITNLTVSNLRYGIYATYNSSVHSRNNTGTGNGTALFAYRGGVISKEGSQPAGTTGELAHYGGVIR